MKPKNISPQDVLSNHMLVQTEKEEGDRKRYYDRNIVGYVVQCKLTGHVVGQYIGRRKLHLIVHIARSQE